MEKQIDKSPASTTTSSTTSRPTSRRTSATVVHESLPTPPPDPPGYDKHQGNIFVYPPIRKDLTRELQSLLNFGEKQNEFQKRLKQSVLSDCRKRHKSPHNERVIKEDTNSCECCEKLCKEYELIIEPLQNRLNASVTTALAAYGTISQLDQLYRIWDHYLSLDRTFNQRQSRLQYVDLLQRKLKDAQQQNSSDQRVLGTISLSDLETTSQEFDHSLIVLESVLKPKQMISNTNPESKIQRERSKSFVIEEIPSLGGQRESGRHIAGIQQLLRRQSAYVDSKAKVSKWTKVKAAFKWEKANASTILESTRNVLTPNNTEVARYLRVPSIPGGGSSPESAFSSSSGHFLSEAGTPGTMSSASSMDDIDNNSQTSKRRDSSKSTDGNMAKSVGDMRGGIDSSATDDSMRTSTPSKSASGKSLRKNKILSDFEVVPEDMEADLNASAKRKNRNPPRPLDLNLKHDLSTYTPSPQYLKDSPQDGTQSLNRTFRKISSPINSSVPSSPSRHSDFFPEFESEDHSSGADFSDPNSPSNLKTRENFEHQQREINRRYEMLRVKLDKEFEAKRREWNKMKANRAMALLTGSKSTEPLLQSRPIPINNNLSTKVLEDNLTPDFRKKLQKWRVKKQASIGGLQSHSPSSPTLMQGEAQAIVTTKDGKIDWQLWKTGQLKLEGQGLSSLPDQKDLPEEFQKKLEQWNKIKRSGTAAICIDSLKWSHKYGGGGGTLAGRKGESDEDKKVDKHKPHDKEKLERLAKLKAIVGEHPVKEIEVKTSAGVMKFEGISRKFTRKLYEWEKARGIGPELSTFALLHPGYCPIDVKRIPKDNQENSPTLSRSLSLDSLAPTATLPVISQQASSLSLNDVNDLPDMKESDVNSTDALLLSNEEFKVFEEPEAVMVEVEDHIVETASPLFATSLYNKPQNAIYKYEETVCNDFCNTRKVHSFDASTNVAPLLNALKNSEELLQLLKKKSPDIAQNVALRQCVNVLAIIRHNYSYYAENLMKPNVLNAISDVQNELSRLRDLCIKAPLDEACCREIMEERNTEYSEELQGFQEALRILQENIQGDCPRYLKDNVPDINVTSEDGLESSQAGSRQADQISTTLEATEEIDTETSCAPVARVSFNGNGNGSSSGGGGGKKRVRLRKVGSLRQNSKTDSDSSEDDTNRSVVATGTPRRIKRKGYRLKQRSFEDDPRALSKHTIYNMMKSKPEENRQKDLENQSIKNITPSYMSPITMSVSLPNVFVKTKRKVFTAIQEPTAINGVAVIEQEIANSPLEKMFSAEDNNLKYEQEQLKRLEKQSEVDLETLLKPRLLLVHKSLSLDDVRPPKYSESPERIVHSVENVKQIVKSKPSTKIRPPLAADSFRLINKHKENLSNQKANAIDQPTVMSFKKEHRFKKHTEEALLKSTKARKIESKINKSQSTHMRERAGGQPNKLNNTLPHIYRKWESKSATLTSQALHFEFPTPTNSEPATPTTQCGLSKGHYTPLTGRALRLKKAKEDFLNGRHQPAATAATIIHQGADKLKSQHESNLSLNSTTADETSLGSESTEVGAIQKSASADTVCPETPPAYSDTGTEQECDSPSRSVRRSNKITSKLGFATLASKFRKVRRGSKKSKRATTTEPTLMSNDNALTALCRQSLLADVIAIPQIITVQGTSEAAAARDCIMKSKSSPPYTLWSDLHSGSPLYSDRPNNERLNKSQSEQYMKRHRKESFV